jgi:diacylglycerol kinase (ATP)
VVNAQSRTGSKAYSHAEEVLRKVGVPVGAAYPLRDPSRLPETVDGAVDAGHDLIILGGGDGTVSSVVDVLAHRGVPMGLLPLGTANDFARTLHIPTDLEQACRTIAHGKVVDIDLGLSGENYYVNRASVGIGAGVAQALSPILKRRIGPLAYPVATVKAFLRHRPFSARLTFPDGDHPPQEYPSLLQISVANGRYYGGGQFAAHDSGIDDSTLDVSVLRHGSPRELIDVARQLRTGRPLNSAQADHFRTVRVDLATEPDLPINVDGELVATTPQRFSVARNALHVVVPQTWADGQ